MKYIELEQNDFQYITHGTIVDTGGLGPCVGVMLYDRGRKEAYAGHFVEPEMGLEEMIIQALATFGKPDQLEVYVVGNSLGENEGILEVMPNYNEYVISTRTYVPMILQKYGFLESQIYTRWSPDFCCASLELDVMTGRTKLEIVDEFDFITSIYRGDIKQAPEVIERRV